MVLTGGCQLATQTEAQIQENEVEQRKPTKETKKRQPER